MIQEDKGDGEGKDDDVHDMVRKEVSEKGEDALEKEDCKDVSGITKEKVKREVHRRV
jgi:hypothetical protein